MKYMLKKDIVIQSGTIFSQSPHKIEMDSDHIEHIFGLSKDTFGRVIYSLEREPDLAEWFEPIP